MDEVWRGAAGLVLAPFSRRTRKELRYCLISLFTGLAGWVLDVTLLSVCLVLVTTVGGALVGVPLLRGLLRLARREGAFHRRMLARHLGRQVEGPAPFVPGTGIYGRIRKRLTDRSAWRALGYTQLKLLVGTVQGYAVTLVGFGLVNMAYPLFWLLFRKPVTSTTSHPMVAVLPVPFGGAFKIGAFPGTFLASLAGFGLVLCGTWLAYGLNGLDERLMLRLLGPRTLAERVSELERTRSLAVEDADAVLRRVERDLHDGAQMRLAALAMNLGMAREKLGAGEGEVRELIDAAQRNATDALAELRDLARGIHPPVLDNGLPDALNSLAATSAIPAAVSCWMPERPAPAIETIAWFCASEIVANATKHSYANHIGIQLESPRPGLLRLVISDDGVGGATIGRGSGLAGLAQRVSTVDGTIDVYSPDGGPTIITVELPMRA